VFSTCIFCNGPLGRNEALEHFTVGRRLAFDAAKGRLWAICPRCERWNLTPLETRWEAIEEAERAYRGMKLRVSTPNIGLARLNEGLELVRVGAPLLPEFAAWRYGDQFGRRRRKHVVIGGAGAVAGMFGSLGGLITGFPALAITMSTLSIGWRIGDVIHRRRRKTRVRTVIRDPLGVPIPMTALHMVSAALIPPKDDGEWRVAVPFGKLLPRDQRDQTRWRHGPSTMFEKRTELTGDMAMRALGAMLPLVNEHGGSKQHVVDAVDVITASTHAHQLVRAASLDDKARNLRTGETNIREIPPRMRLALEIMLHQDDERRAMEGELRELEARWRDADAIAGIADSLTLSPEIEERLATLKADMR